MVIVLFRFVVLAVLLTGVHGCTTSFSDLPSDYVEVSSLNVAHEATPERMTQAQLREEIERFVFRFAGRLHPYLEAIANTANTPEQRLRVHKWKKQLSYSLIKIASSEDPETGLLDMLVLVTLVRIESEENLVPESFFGDKGQDWLQVVYRSETEIWSIAEEVLDPKQQAAIRKLIHDWRLKNPEVKSFLAFRFSDFAAEADDADSLVQSGGFLPEVTEATRAVDEIRQTSERAMFLALVSPTLARLEAETFIYDLTTQPEYKEYRSILKQFSETSAKLATVSEQLPSWVSHERQAAVDQAMDRLFDERDKMFAEIDVRSVQLQELFVQIREALKVGGSLTSQLNASMTTLDSLVTRLGIDKVSSEKGAFPIEVYRETLSKAAVTAGEINIVLQSLNQFLDADLGGQAGPSAAAALQVLDQHIERWILWEFVALAGLVMFTGIVVLGILLFYRWSLIRTKTTL